MCVMYMLEYVCLSVWMCVRAWMCGMCVRLSTCTRICVSTVSYWTHVLMYLFLYIRYCISEESHLSVALSSLLNVLRK